MNLYSNAYWNIFKYALETYVIWLVALSILFSPLGVAFFKLLWTPFLRRIEAQRKAEEEEAKLPIEERILRELKRNTEAIRDVENQVYWSRRK